MKIGIVWENGVSKWMSQMFEPLADIPGVDVTVFVGDRNKYDTKDVKLKKCRLTHREDIQLGIFSLPHSLIRIVKNPYKKMDFYYNSLNKYLEGYDIVECSDSSRSLYTLAMLKRHKSFKLVVSYAENIPYRQLFDEKTNKIKHSTYEMVDHFIPWCDTIKKTLLLEGVPEEKITTVYTGLDLNLFRPEPKDAGFLKENRIGEEDFVILYIGKLVSWKGVHMLAYAAKVLASKGYENFRFVVTGRGAQLENLQKIIKEAQVEQYFRFTGFLPYKNIRKLYNLADVFVLPSYPTMTWQEQFGMVLVEAMACGKPIVASATGSIPEVVGDGGITFVPGNFFEFADRISMLMNNRDFARELGEKGKKRAETYFDAERNASQLYEVYKKVLSKQSHKCMSRSMRNGL